MAEEEFMSQAMANPEDESDDFYGGIYHNPGIRNLSRLSVCTSSFTTNESCDFYEENDAREGGSGGRNGGHFSLCGGDDGDAVGSYFSMLSIENFDADAEFSEDEEEEEVEEGEGEGSSSLSSCSMLGASPREAWRARQGLVVSKDEYASANEAQKGKENRTKKKKETVMKRVGFGSSESGSGRWGRQNSNDGGGRESDCCGGGGGNGLMVMTRAKGGNSRLWMDMEEVKACRQLGLELELEHERTVEIPGRISISGSVDTGGSSGGNSPIANWRISSPGDDPRDVKARLKVWAQMVALASSSLHSN
ncbi:hypothetical protein MLD38_009057 [Melastoma candidum]|uniref:Uncharacterized protein n=1 Tax=Melastoma candidum TaxID=119954 RepID=A0ACB9RVS3_9MYRT|nr:hypothetical protein MLD38_009057 [Melastoma candidum]